MSAVTYDDVRRQAEQLDSDERTALLEFLLATLVDQESVYIKRFHEKIAHRLQRQISIALADTLDKNQIDRLTQQLQTSLDTSDLAPSFLLLLIMSFSQPRSRVTRETLLAEMEELRAQGAFEGVESLRNKYAEPSLDLSDEELHASIRGFSQEWEQDLDDLFNGN